MSNTKRWVACLAAAIGLGQAGCQTWVGGMTLPSPRYLQHYPQYFSPDPEFPLPRELASQEDPTGTIRAGGGAGGAGPAPVAPAAPVPLGGGAAPGMVGNPGR